MPRLCACARPGGVRGQLAKVARYGDNHGPARSCEYRRARLFLEYRVVEYCRVRVFRVFIRRGIYCLSLCVGCFVSSGAAYWVLFEVPGRGQGVVRVYLDRYLRGLH